MQGYFGKNASAIIESASRYYGRLGCAAMAIMAITVTTDVMGRFLLGKPFPGGPEMVEQFMVCTIYFMLPHVTKEDKHIRVDIFVSKLSRVAPRLQCATAFIFDIIILVLLAFLAWQGFAGSIDALRSGEVTDTLSIPHYPFHILLAVGFTLAFLSFLMKFAQGLVLKLKGV